MSAERAAGELTHRTDERDEAVLIEVASVIGNKWHPVIIHHLAAEGSLGFSELLSRVSGITNRMLSRGLDRLEEEDVVDRTVLHSKPVRVEYSLTERGEAMSEVVGAMLRCGYCRREEVESDACDRE